MSTRKKGSWLNAAVYGTVSLGLFIFAGWANWQDSIAWLPVIGALVFFVLALHEAWNT